MTTASTSSRTAIPQLAAVPLLGRVATLYTDAAGRFGMKELVNLVTEWSDPVEGQASGDGPLKVVVQRPKGADAKTYHLTPKSGIGGVDL